MIGEALTFGALTAADVAVPGVGGGIRGALACALGVNATAVAVVSTVDAATGATATFGGADAVNRAVVATPGLCGSGGGGTPGAAARRVAAGAARQATSTGVTVVLYVTVPTAALNATLAALSALARDTNAGAGALTADLVAAGALSAAGNGSAVTASQPWVVTGTATSGGGGGAAGAHTALLAGLLAGAAVILVLGAALYAVCRRRAAGAPTPKAAGVLTSVAPARAPAVDAVVMHEAPFTRRTRSAPAAQPRRGDSAV